MPLSSRTAWTTLTALPTCPRTTDDDGIARRFPRQHEPKQAQKCGAKTSAVINQDFASG
jgi:hypothetical protein